MPKLTVKDVFDLRKQGYIEEAYEAIKPMYAVHKGRYTSLCMFWTAADVFKLRLDQGRTEEAGKILEALNRMLPRVEKIIKELDRERPVANATYRQAENKVPLPWEKGEPNNADEQNKAAAFIEYATRRLAKIKSSHGASDTIEKSTRLSPSLHPEKQSPQENNLHDLQDLAQQEKKELPSGEYLSGHLTVSLEDGIITQADLNAPQRIVLACLVAHPGYTVPQISESTGIPQKSIERHIPVLIERNLIEQRGSKTGGYYLVK